MAHLVEIKGSELEGFWFVCICEVEGNLYAEQDPAEMEAEVHMVAETEPSS
jgi:hypothetical protein